MSTLSVVLLTKNQGWNLSRLIESVLLDPAAGSDAEIVVVDSGSSDGSAAIAATYPVTVLSLDAREHLSAAKARAHGYVKTLGDLVLFLDGDMELVHGWLRQARDILAADAEVAVVGGDIHDLPPESLSPAPVADSGTASFRTARYSAGGGLHRRSALDRCGTFDSALFSEEEPELALRLRVGGYRLVHVDRLMAYHYSPARHRIGTLLARRKRRLYLGGGQILRKHGFSVVGRLYLRERAFGLPVLGLALSHFVALRLNRTRRDGWLRRIAPLLSGVFVVVTAWRMKTPYRTVHSLLQRVLWAEGTVRGFLLRR